MNNIASKLKEIINEEAGVEGYIGNDSTLDDLGLDSLDVVEITMAVEDEFNIEIPDEDVERMECFGDAVKYLESIFKKTDDNQAIKTKTISSTSLKSDQSAEVITSPNSTLNTEINISSEILMLAAQPDLYRTNAFRISGLPIDATTRDISRQVEKIKMMEKYGGIKLNASGPFPLDPPPDSEDTREALQRLRDPERRLIDEFFWFWPHTIGQSNSDKALQALSRNDIKSAKELWINYEAMSSEANVSMHNLAVVSHLLALDFEFNGDSKSLNVKDVKMRDYYWLESFKRWKILLDHEGFWSRLAARVRLLDDPRLTTGTVRRIRETLPVALLFINASSAVKAAEAGNNSETKRHLKIIKDSGFDTAVIENSLLKAVDPIRNRIKTICKAADEEGEENPKKAHQVARKVIDQTKQLLSILDLILPTDNPMREGAHDEVALSVLTNLISYGNETSKWEKPFELVKKALKIAISESARSRIQMNYDTIKVNYEYDLEYNTCFFCKENPPEDDATVEVDMHGDIERVWNKVHWRYLTVKVPRCDRCKGAHNRITALSWIGALVFGVFGFAQCVSIMDADEDMWFGALLAFGVITSIGAGIGYLIGKLTSPKETKPKSHYYDFSRIRELLNLGWEFGERPSDVEE